MCLEDTTTSMVPLRRFARFGSHVRFYHRRLSGEDHLFPSKRPDVNQVMWPSKMDRGSPCYDVTKRKRVVRLEREDFKSMIQSKRRSVSSQSFVLKTKRDSKPGELPRSSVMVEKSILKRAVIRNLCKRRLREAARHVLPTYASRGKFLFSFSFSYNCFFFIYIYIRGRSQIFYYRPKSSCCD